jgi:aquaporin Z
VGAGRAAAPVLVVVPFAFGLALLAGLYAFGEVSGGHFNPAVSPGFFLDRRLSAADLLGY